MFNVKLPAAIAIAPGLRTLARVCTLLTASLKARKSYGGLPEEYLPRQLTGTQRGTQPGQREIFLRVFADVIDQAFRDVVGRIDRQTISSRERVFRARSGNLPGVGFNFRRECLSASPFYSTAHLREIPQLVVQVAGDAKTSFSSASCCSMQLQPAPQLLPWKITHHGTTIPPGTSLRQCGNHQFARNWAAPSRREPRPVRSTRRLHCRR